MLPRWPPSVGSAINLSFADGTSSRFKLAYQPFFMTGDVLPDGKGGTALGRDADQVESIRRFGWKVFYGDASRLDLLRIAGAAQAKVFVLAIDDVDKSVDVAKLVKEHFPHLVVVARARNVTHYYRLRQLGVSLIERETLDSALMSARSVLETLGWQPHTARTQALRFRQHNVELVEQMAPHLGDQKKLIALAKAGRQQLEQLWAQERADAAAARNRHGWHAKPDGRGSSNGSDSARGGREDPTDGQAGDAKADTAQPDNLAANDEGVVNAPREGAAPR